MDSVENDKKNILNYIVVKDGSVEKNETLTDFSKEFVAHMLDEFKLTDYLEKKYLGKILINPDRSSFYLVFFNAQIELINY